MTPWLDAGDALRLHTALLADSLGLLRAAALESGATPFVSFSEAWDPESRPGGEDLARAAAGIVRLPQSGADLGGRLRDTFRRLFSRGFRRVAVIGSDSPTLPPAILKTAFAALRRDGDVVLGPAEDGGYYLVGARHPVPQIFDRIPWGTDRVMEATLAALDRRGARAIVLPRWYDIDLPRDLERVRLDLSGRSEGHFVPERTRAFVEELVRGGRLPLKI